MLLLSSDAISRFVQALRTKLEWLISIKTESSSSAYHYNTECSVLHVN